MEKWLLSLINRKSKIEESKPLLMYHVPFPVDRIPVESKIKFGIKGIDYVEEHNIIDGTTRRI